VLNRRELLIASAAAAVVAACTGGDTPTSTATSTATEPATAPGAAAPAVTASGNGPAQFVPSGPSSSPAVALTFHTNGDPSLCNALFEQAKQLHAPLTLFMVGSWLHDHPDVAGRLLADGHELANHTYTHPELGKLGAGQVAEEITRCRDELSAVTGQPSRWFRPSGIDAPTALILEEAGQAGYGTVIGYDVDPHDYQDPGTVAVADRVRQRLHPGAIVSLHTSHQGTLDAFADIVGSIRAVGLQPVTVSDLLGAP
jgi:peptidoglycan/xylan/chitin deacetylase (PgdA/CDA1 family)